MPKRVYGMAGPATRKEFERNISLLVEETYGKLDSGNESLIQNVMWATYPGLSKVMKLPNGRTNLATIEERIRLQANMINWMDR